MRFNVLLMKFDCHEGRKTISVEMSFQTRVYVFIQDVYTRVQVVNFLNVCRETKWIEKKKYGSFKPMVRKIEKGKTRVYRTEKKRRDRNIFGQPVLRMAISEIQ